MVAQANEAQDAILVDTTIPETSKSSEAPGNADVKVEKDDDDDTPAPMTEEKPVVPTPVEDTEAEHLATYAEAVKVHTRERTIPEEPEPSSPTSTKRSPASNNEGANEAEEEESSTLLDKTGDTQEASSSAALSPPTPAKDLRYPNEEADSQIPSPRRPAETPTRERPTSYPFPRSVSHNSNLASPQSGSSTPSRSPSHQNLSSSISNSSTGHGTPSAAEDKGGKTRKRLSSLKGFVRRISDQGGGLARSNSTGKPGSRGGGLASPDAGAEGAGVASPAPSEGRGKKRLSLNRGNSQQ